MPDKNKSNSFASAIVGLIEDKTPTGRYELKCMDVVQNLQDDKFTFEEMLIIIEKSKTRIYKMIELMDLDNKFEGNE